MKGEKYVWGSAGYKEWKRGSFVSWTILLKKISIGFFSHRRFYDLWLGGFLRIEHTLCVLNFINPSILSIGIDTHTHTRAYIIIIILVLFIIIFVIVCYVFLLIQFNEFHIIELYH